MLTDYLMHHLDKWSHLVSKITYGKISKYFPCHTILVNYNICTRIPFKTNHSFSFRLSCTRFINQDSNTTFLFTTLLNFLTDQVWNKHVNSPIKRENRILPLVKDQSQCFHPSNQAMLFATVGFHLLLLKPTK